ncbi:MAG: hypothetical protein HQM00_12300 [Magnetococcales bacterium]|nr:hypothetical protein [Magnetococcales bacterium]
MNVHIIQELNQAIERFHQETRALITRIEPHYYVDIKHELIRLIGCLADELETIKHNVLADLEKQRKKISPCPNNECLVKNGVYCPHNLTISLQQYEDGVKEYTIPNPTNSTNPITQKFFNKTSLEILQLAKPVLHRFRDIHRAAIYHLYRELNYPKPGWFRPVPSVSSATCTRLTPAKKKNTTTPQPDSAPRSWFGKLKASLTNHINMIIRIIIVISVGFTLEISNVFKISNFLNFNPEKLDLSLAYKQIISITAVIVISILFVVASKYAFKMVTYILMATIASLTILYALHLFKANPKEAEKPNPIEVTIHSSIMDSITQITKISTELSEINKTIALALRNLKQPEPDKINIIQHIHGDRAPETPTPCPSCPQNFDVELFKDFVLDNMTILKPSNKSSTGQ